MKFTVQRRAILFAAVSVVLLSLSIGLLAPFSSVSAESAAGSLDSTFGSGGTVTTPFFGYDDEAAALAVQPDGLLLAAGVTAKQPVTNFSFNSDSDDFAVARYRVDGSLDPSFGNAGKVTTDFFGFEDVAAAMVLQPDGKIVVAGAAAKQTDSGGTNLDSMDFALARYNPDGSLDAGFGSGGKVTTDFFGFQDRVGAVALQTDGKIVAAGFAQKTAGISGLQEFAVARYNGDGSLDTTFGAGGKAVLSFFAIGDSAAAVAIQSDGKIVLAGSAAFGLGVDMALARFNPDGTLDKTFGVGGEVIDGFGIEGSASCIAIQQDGKIVAAGMAVYMNQIGDIIYVGNEFAAARFNADGSPDTSFGSAGNVIVPGSGFSNQPLVVDNVQGIAVQPDGKIILGGTVVAAEAGDQSAGFGMTRLDAQGSIDGAFGTEGYVTTHFFGNSGSGQALVLEPDATIALAGFAAPQNQGREFALARYLAGSIPGDFFLTATPQSQTVSAGQSTSFAIDLQVPTADSARALPSATTAALSAAVSPSTGGVTANFSTASVDVPGSATLNVSTASTTPLGTYTITITSTAGTITQKTSATLIVSGPDFALSFGQSTISAQPGTKVSVVINISRFGGDTDQITVTPPAPGNGIKAKPPGPIATAANSVRFKFKLAPNVGAGTYQLAFTAADQSGHTHSATANLVVQ